MGHETHTWKLSWLETYSRYKCENHFLNLQENELVTFNIVERFSIPNFDVNHEEKQREIEKIEKELARDLFKSPTYAHDIYSYLKVIEQWIFRGMLFCELVYLGIGVFMNEI